MVLAVDDRHGSTRCRWQATTQKSESKCHYWRLSGLSRCADLNQTWTILLGTWSLRRHHCVITCHSAVNALFRERKKNQFVLSLPEGLMTFITCALLLLLLSVNAILQHAMLLTAPFSCWPFFSSLLLSCGISPESPHPPSPSTFRACGASD